MSAPHATVVGGAGWLRPGRYVINHRLPEPAALPARPLRGHKWFTTEGSNSTEEKPHMTQSQSRPRNPASWHPAEEREGLWIFTRLRDFIDDIANTTPARLALS